MTFVELRALFDLSSPGPWSAHASTKRWWVGAGKALRVCAFASAGKRELGDAGPDAQFIAAVKNEFGKYVQLVTELKRAHPSELPADVLSALESIG